MAFRTIKALTPLLAAVARLGLVSYAARPAISNRRVSLADPDSPDGDLVYELKNWWTDGTTAVKFSHGEFLVPVFTH